MAKAQPSDGVQQAHVELRCFVGTLVAVITLVGCLAGVASFVPASGLRPDAWSSFRYLRGPSSQANAFRSSSNSSGSSSRRSSGSRWVATGRDEVHVAYSTDAGGFVGLMSSMLSLTRASKDPAKLRVHLIVSRQSMDAATNLLECFWRELGGSKDKRPAVELHELRPPRFQIGSNKFQPQLSGKAEVFARLYLDSYLPTDVARVVWIDSDTIIRSDVKDLYNVNMTHALAAVREAITNTFRTIYFAQQGSDTLKLKGLVDKPDTPVFNSGVMVVDLQKWRHEHLSEAVSSWASVSDDASDQLMLNLEFQLRRGFDELDLEWNTYNLGCAEWMHPKYPHDVIERAKILHWSGPTKPWQTDRAALYHQYDPYVEPHLQHRQCLVLPGVPGS